MKKLSETNMSQIEGGLTNRECLFLGGLTIVAAAVQTGSVLGLLTNAIAGGCFSKW